MNTKFIDALYVKINDLETKNFALRSHLAYLSGYLGSSSSAGSSMKDSPMTSDQQLKLSKKIDKILDETDFLV